MRAVGLGVALSHQHAGANPAGTAYDTRHAVVIGGVAGGKVATGAGENAHHRTRFDTALIGDHVKLLGEIGATGDFQLVGDDAALARGAKVGVQFDGG